MTEQAKVPAIRFAGFTDPWEQRKLGELEKDATLYMGRGRVISAKDMSNTPGTFPVYSSSALDNGRMGAYGKYMFNQELITWSIDGGGAVFYRRKHRFSVTNVSGYIAVNPEKINCKFLAYAMSLAHSRIKFDYTVKAHPSVIRSLYTMGIPISLQEQQVIGSFFSRLDNLITLHQRKYDKLVILKKSMLEKMFPKDGESVPEIRFAGFTDPWEQRKLGDYVVVSTAKNADGRFNKEDVLSVSGEYGIVNQIAFQGRSFAGSSVLNYGIVNTGDIVYTKSPLNSNPYGIIKVNKGIPGIVSTLYAVYRPQDNVHTNFIQVYFEQHERMNNYMHPLVNKGAKNDMKVTAENALKGVVTFPSREEQVIISEFFDRLDSLITLHQRKLELLRNIKKSLLDKMFV